MNGKGMVKALRAIESVQAIQVVTGDSQGWYPEAGSQD